MWVNTEVDALVTFIRGLQFPLLEAIRWNSRRIDFTAPARVERATMSLNYRCTEGLTRYAIRFEPMQQRWYLEAIDDSGLAGPERGSPPPSLFPPTTR